MPKEISRSVTRGGWMHAMVCWGEGEWDDYGNPAVRLFALPARDGGIMFHPDHPEDFGLDPGSSVGPVYAILDEEAVDGLIRSLRRAKRKVFVQPVRTMAATAREGAAGDS